MPLLPFIKWFLCGPSDHGLTVRQVVKIKELYLTGNYTQKEIGNRFGVSQSRISRILQKSRQAS